jgi:hypothetical protein
MQAQYTPDQRFEFVLQIPLLKRRVPAQLLHFLLHAPRHLQGPQQVQVLQSLQLPKVDFYSNHKLRSTEQPRPRPAQ